jgi:hypothetical protein
MSETVGQFPIVRDQEQTLGVRIQPAGGVQASSHVTDQVQHRLPTSVIHSCRQRSPRLVQQDVDVRLRAHRAPINLHPRAAGINLGPRIDYYPAVNLHSAAADQVRGLAARGHARGGDEL